MVAQLLEAIFGGIFLILPILATLEHKHLFQSIQTEIREVIRDFLLVFSSMKLRLFQQLRVIDSSNCNRKCAANWVYQLETGLRQEGYWLEKKSLRVPVRMNMPFICKGKVGQQSG